MTVTYKRLSKVGSNLQVDSAIRDEDGYRFSTVYPKKIEQDVNLISNSSNTYTVRHQLNAIPSAVSLYMEKDGQLEQIGADISATASNVRITLTNPLDIGIRLLIKIVI